MLICIFHKQETEEDAETIHFSENLFPARKKREQKPETNIIYLYIDSDTKKSIKPTYKYKPYNFKINSLLRHLKRVLLFNMCLI